MQIGFSLHNNWGVEDVQAIIRLASQVEELGFASVWVHDHVFNAAHVSTRTGRKHPYRIEAVSKHCHDFMEGELKQWEGSIRPPKAISVKPML